MSAKFLTLVGCFAVLCAVAQAPDGQMQLRVVDAQTGQPLPAVKVRAWSGTGLVTDQAGTCSFPLPHPGNGRFFYRIALTRSGYVPRYITWSQAQNDKIQDIPSQYTARMDPGVTIGAIVKNENGEPIPGARVIFSGSPPATDGQRERNAVAPNYFSERTGEDGRWQCSEAPKEFRNLTFRVIHPDYVPAMFACEGGDVTDPSIVQWKESDFLSGTAVMLLTHGIELAGIVVDSSGEPVPQTTITRNHEWRNPAAALATGDDGRFKIINLRPGEMILTFQAAGLAAQTTQLTLSNGMPELRIELKPGNLFQGMVVDESGKPISGALVQMDRLDLGPMEYDWSTATDDQGRFEWNSAPEGPHPYYFSASGFRSRSEPELVADSHDKIISLRHAANGDKTIIDVHVMDAGSKSPITKFSVYLKEFKGGAVAHSQQTVSTTNGAYSVAVDPSCIGCMIEIAAPGYAPRMSEKRSARDGDQRLDFALEKGEAIAGTVFMPDGKPAAGAEVAISAAAARVSLGQAHFEDRFQTNIAAADGDGNFVLPQSAGAQALCAVHESGFAETNIDGVKGPIRITLAPWGTVNGIVNSAGKPLKGQKVALFRPPPESGQPGVSLDRDDFAATTMEDGGFVFSNVPAGKTVLLQIAKNGASPLQYFDITAGHTTGPVNANADVAEDGGRPNKELKIGDVAPPFVVKTIDGQPLRLADYKGKYVLLDFWATWCGPCIGETPHLKSVFNTFGGDDHFVMIGLSLDDALSAPADYARKNDIKWIQGFLGSWTASSVTPLYGVDAIPSIFLIDPEGKIIGRDLRGDGISEAVGKALGKR